MKLGAADQLNFFLGGEGGLNKNHYAPVSHSNWCNMTFTAGNLFPSHSCIGVTRVKPPLGFESRYPG